MLPFVSEYIFQIEMIDPCFASVMDPLLIDDMQRAVKQAGTTQSLLDVQDLVSRTFGNQDGLTYCGPRVFELTTDPTLYSPFLSFDTTTNLLNVQTDDDNDIGIHLIDAKVSLQHYPAIFETVQF